MVVKGIFRVTVPDSCVGFDNAGLWLGVDFRIEGYHGAPERNNLEPSECERVLEELENWTEVLKSEPEVIHRLAKFARAADGELEDDIDGLLIQSAFEEPSP